MKTALLRSLGILIWICATVSVAGAQPANNQGYFMPPPKIIEVPEVSEVPIELPAVETEPVEPQPVVEKPLVEEPQDVAEPEMVDMAQEESHPQSVAIVQDYMDQVKVEDTLASMASLRAVLTKTDEQVHNVVNAMNFLAETNEADRLMDNPLTKQFKKFIQEIEKTQTHIEALRDASGTMEEQAAAYFAAWESNLESFNNNSIRNRSRRRLTVTQRDFDQIMREVDRLKTKIEPFLAQLVDTRNFLNYDLNIEAIDSISDVFKKINTESERNLEQIATVVEKLDALSTSMSPRK
ncbi:MAG: DUF2959 family protein [Candidatus Omnitrophica bacterium]|nr:DUF2959 family protein [Candidatus Omnitrophota bacterium]